MRTCLPKVALTAVCSAAVMCAGARAADKGLSAAAARDLIRRVAGLELKKDAVKVKGVTTGGASASAVAAIRIAFFFERDDGGRWRMASVRAGEGQWESFELLAAALGAELTANARAQLESVAEELAALQKSKDDKPGDLVRGPLRVRTPRNALAALLSSATVEAEIEATFAFDRDARGSWRVACVSVGGARLPGFYAILAGLNAAKSARARADLDKLAATLEAYRRERGTYVVADTEAVLVDHLTPRYLPGIIRRDPWHRPYEYEGTRTRFTLRSAGPDGKVNTPDDVTVSGGDAGAR